MCLLVEALPPLIILLWLCVSFTTILISKSCLRDIVILRALYIALYMMVME